ncbi:hypothetical protein DWF00_02425 [Bosea caraganae]|uniref:Alkaline proteinase inhibitor/ Outer membrane lipoprotein Omp19 domain-containing protein n=2 Tax=Bosea caraganae TaxID=2763117 RepID=A0A370L377_9HYPH|nr:AprI/Inh family metalloprotease inhibitor [Bosea caraganae]RDJ22631.1 hypothetical protein DWE98_18590 [Bosea caraganae]RDJ30476.1 hypothetical protein DWF00_02425 [Bosea caraganae]
MTGAANRNSLLKAASLLPLLALTACAGSQRFSGGPFSSEPAYSQPSRPSYSQPDYQPAPPIGSAPVTSEPLPPPGGYPAGNYPSASAPLPASSGGPLPPPGDPYYQPSPPPSAPNTPPPLGNPAGAPPAQSGGQVATLGAGAGSGRGAVTSRDGVVGNWTAREATGTSCRVQLSSSPTLDLYRANASGCANRDLQKVNAWDYRDGEIYLYQSGGSVVARLRASDGGALSGAVTKSGAALSMNR